MQYFLFFPEALAHGLPQYILYVFDTDTGRLEQRMVNCCYANTIVSSFNNQVRTHYCTLLIYDCSARFVDG
jgi:hypothetical protein